jgi:hypothetical protein
MKLSHAVLGFSTVFSQGFAQNYDAVDIREMIAHHDMSEIKSTFESLIPFIESEQVAAVEQLKSLAGNFAGLIPELEVVEGFEIRQKLAELDLEFIRAELDFLAQENLLTNLVNFMSENWAQVQDTVNEVLPVQVLGGANVADQRDVGIVHSRKRRSTIGDIIFLLVLLFIFKAIFGASSATSAAVALNSSVGMGLMVLFVARKLLA